MNIRFHESVCACLRNGLRLLEEAELLELCEPPTTAHFLTQIAQEEFAKAFLLALVAQGVIPWDTRLVRAAHNHVCKQLLCVVMDHIAEDTDRFLERCSYPASQVGVVPLPGKVVDALNILRHEKLGRWVKQTWVWADEIEYDREALAIESGVQDRVKQDLLYVRLGRNGDLVNSPHGTTTEDVRSERARGERMAQLAKGALNGEDNLGLDYDRVLILFKALFESLPRDKEDT